MTFVASTPEELATELYRLSLMSKFQQPFTSCGHVAVEYGALQDWPGQVASPVLTLNEQALLDIGSTDHCTLQPAHDPLQDLQNLVSAIYPSISLPQASHQMKNPVDGTLLATPSFGANMSLQSRGIPTSHIENILLDGVAGGSPPAMWSLAEESRRCSPLQEIQPNGMQFPAQSSTAMHYRQRPSPKGKKSHYKSRRRHSASSVVTRAPTWADSTWHPMAVVVASGQLANGGTGVFLPQSTSPSEPPNKGKGDRSQRPKPQRSFSAGEAGLSVKASGGRVGEVQQGYGEKGRMWELQGPCSLPDEWLY